MRDLRVASWTHILILGVLACHIRFAIATKHSTQGRHSVSNQRSSVMIMRSAGNSTERGTAVGELQGMAVTASGAVEVHESLRHNSDPDEPEEQGPYFQILAACTACRDQFCSASTFKSVPGTCVYKQCANQGFPGSTLWCWMCAPDSHIGTSSRCDQA
mmetsp:Transcript_52465/g.125361  ORF Transcript_52465/g.125361 Transcript_52465/m.125361 type:complete len:159 (+) Transcript_52465:150-626(+)